ncbi:MAG: sensor domain-containing protein [Candidatus Aquicultorales bacterium]
MDKTKSLRSLLTGIALGAFFWLMSVVVGALSAPTQGFLSLQRVFEILFIMTSVVYYSERQRTCTELTTERRALWQKAEQQVDRLSKEIREAKSTERSLRKSEEHYRQLVEHMPDPVIVNVNGKIDYVNSSALALFGLTEASDLIGKRVDYLIKCKLNDRDRTRVIRDKVRFLHNSDHILRPDGTIIYVQAIRVPLESDSNISEQIVLRNINHLVEAKEVMAFESKLLDAATDSVIVHDLQGKIVYANGAACSMTGYSKQELLSRTIQSLNGGEGTRMISDHWDAMVRTGSTVFEITERRKTGEFIPVEVHARTVTYGEGQFCVRISRDVSERKKAEKIIERLAYYDALTKLPNRVLFSDRLTMQLAEAQRKNERFAIAYLDLDGFKIINDTLGHDHGDRLLCQVAKRLREVTRKSDFVARLGGDEFALLFVDIRDEDEAKKLAEKLLRSFVPPFCAGDHKPYDYESYAEASIGIALYPKDGSDSETLLKNADIAMYQAKGHGRNRYMLYEPSMNEMSRRRLSLENDLRQALEREQFSLHYQPQINLETGTLVGVEALLRWRHPDRGMVAPEEFIWLAEENGLIIPIGQWVLMTACQQSRAWQKMGFPKIRMAVNLSPLQFNQSDLLTNIESVLKYTGLDPDLLELEITETAAMRDPDHAIQVLGALREIGTQIAIDDFGTGHSALDCLKSLPINTIKIPQGFVQDAHKDVNSGVIANTIITLGHMLGLNTVAEGVETKSQLGFLRNSKCNDVQGYLLSKPLPAAQLSTLIQSKQSLVVARSQAEVVSLRKQIRRNSFYEEAQRS